LTVKTPQSLLNFEKSSVAILKKEVMNIWYSRKNLLPR